MKGDKVLISIIALVLLLLAAGWLFGSSSPEKNSNNQQDQVKQDQNKVAAQDKLSEQYANKAAKVKTNFGNFTIVFFDNDAPLAVENFIRLSQEGRYDRTKFHRIAKGFVIQGGDYTNGDGTGGRSIWDEPFKDELYSNTESYQMGYKRGVMAMANSGPNTNSSQFFINLADNDSLPHNYTIFGKVTEGIEVLDEIAEVPVLENAFGEKSVPTQDVVIESISIEDR